MGRPRRADGALPRCCPAARSSARRSRVAVIPGRSCGWRMSRGQRRPTRGGGCCGVHELNKSGTGHHRAHDMTLMDQYDARRLCCIRDGCISMSSNGDDHGPGGSRTWRRNCRRAAPIVADRAGASIAAARWSPWSHHDLPRLDHDDGAVLLVRVGANGSPRSRAKSPSRCVPAGRDIERDVAAVREADAGAVRHRRDQALHQGRVRQNC